jgi:hypothetical protein
MRPFLEALASQEASFLEVGVASQEELMSYLAVLAYLAVAPYQEEDYSFFIYFVRE